MKTEKEMEDENVSISLSEDDMEENTMIMEEVVHLTPMEQAYPVVQSLPGSERRDKVVMFMIVSLFIMALLIVLYGVIEYLWSFIKNSTIITIK
jgi:hypothetical protein